MGVYIREKAGKLYLDTYVGGRRTWESLHMTLTGDRTTDREMRRLADIIRGRREIAIASGEHGLIDPAAGKRSLASYSKEVADRAGSAKLAQTAKYIEAFAGPLALGAVTERTCEDFARFLRDQDLALSTAARTEGYFRQILRTAVRDRLIPRSPADAVKRIHAPDAVHTALTKEDFSKLAVTPLGGDLGADVRKGFLFACLTGLRRSDVKRLAWGNVKRDPLSLELVTKKTGKTLTVPLSPGAWALINDGRIHHADERVFPIFGETDTDPHRYMVRWAEAAGLSHPVMFHDSRRAFATWALEGGADALTVQRLLGHSKLAMTALYAKSTTEAYRRAVDSLPTLPAGWKEGHA